MTSDFSVKSLQAWLEKHYVKFAVSPSLDSEATFRSEIAKYRKFLLSQEREQRSKSLSFTGVEAVFDFFDYAFLNVNRLRYILNDREPPSSLNEILDKFLRLPSHKRSQYFFPRPFRFRFLSPASADDIPDDGKLKYPSPFAHSPPRPPSPKEKKVDQVVKKRVIVKDMSEQLASLGLPEDFFEELPSTTPVRLIPDRVLADIISERPASDALPVRFDADKYRCFVDFLRINEGLPLRNPASVEADFVSPDVAFSEQTLEEKITNARVASKKGLSLTESGADRFYVNLYKRERHHPLPPLSSAQRGRIEKIIRNYFSSPHNRKKKLVLVVNGAFEQLCLNRDRRSKVGPELWSRWLELADIYVTSLNYSEPTPLTHHLMVRFSNEVRVAGQTYSSPPVAFDALCKVFHNPFDREWLAFLTCSLTPSLLDLSEWEDVETLLSMAVRAAKTARERSVFAFLEPTSKWSVGGVITPGPFILGEIRKKSHSIYFSRFDRLLAGLSFGSWKHLLSAAPLPDGEDRHFQMMNTGITGGVFADLVTQAQEFPGLAPFIKLLCHMSLLSTHTSITGWISHLGVLSIEYSSYCLSFVSEVGNMIDTVVSALSGEMKFQSSDDDYLVFAKKIFLETGEGFSGSELGQSLWDLIGSFSIVGCMAASGLVGSVATVRSYLREFTALLKTDGSRVAPLESFVEKFFRFVKLLLGRLKDAVQSRDIRKIFRHEMSIEDWSRLCEALVDDESVRYDPARPSMATLFRVQREAGLVPYQIVKPLTVPERVEHLDVCLDYGTTLQVRHKGDIYLSTLVRNRIGYIRNALRALSVMGANSAYRIVPWALFIEGRPGCGKTTLSSRVHCAIGESLGFDTSDGTMYRPDPQSNYHDTYQEGMWACSMDDVDQSMAAESASVMNHSQTINKFVNSAPFPMEKADLSEKGKFWANFLTLYYTTNFADGKLRGHCEEPAQFWRRFPIYISMEVKPEFANSDGGLDSAKAFDGAVPHPNMWLYHVKKYDPSATSYNERFEKVPYKLVHTFDNDSDLMRSLIAHFTQFYEREKDVLRKRLAERSDAKCTLCSLALSQHPERQQCSGDFVKLQSLSLSVDASHLVLVCFLYYAFPVAFTRIFDFYNRLEGDLKTVVCTAFLRRLLGVGNYNQALVELAVLRLPKKIRNSMATLLENDYRQAFKLNAGKIGLALTGLIATVAILRKYFAPDAVKLRLQGAHLSNPTGFPKRQDVWGKLTPSLYEREYSTRVKPTFTVEEFQQVLRRRVCYLRYGKQALCGIAIGHGAVVFPRHLLFEESSGPAASVEAVIEVKVNTAWLPVKLQHASTIHNRDIIIAYIPEFPVFKEKWKLFNEMPETCLAQSSHRCDAAWLVRPDGVYEYESRLQGSPGYFMRPDRKEASWQGMLPTSDGDCGSPVVGIFGDRFYLLGFHTVGKDPRAANPRPGMAESFSRVEIREAFDRIRAIQPNSLEIVTDPACVSPISDALHFQAFPEKSSYNVSHQFREGGIPFIPFGMLVDGPKFGTTNKSMVVPTIFNSDIYSPCFPGILAPGEKFTRPSFGGRMITVGDGDESFLRWMDPHCRSIESYVNIGGDASLWEKAVADYLEGVTELPGTTGYVPLSDYATCVGIDATVAGPIDLKTSAGAPFFSKKAACIHINRDTPVPEVEFHVTLREGIERLLEVIDAGDVYSPPAVLCLKDEVVTNVKNENFKVRVFKNMPLSLNFLLKKYISPIVSFTRDNNFFFEHVIGANIAGVVDAKKIADFIQVFPNVCASDVSDFDVTASTRELYYASLVVLKLSAVLGYTPLERKRVWGLLMSSMHVTNICKGDFFLTNFGLASGYWVTLFLNCIRNSLQARYAFFDLQPRGFTPSFRACVKQLVLGDDNISCVRDDCGWFNQISIARSLTAIGAKRTSSVKGRALTEYEPIAEATFLKRILREVDGVPVWPIEKKTLLRMLSCRRRDTQLSVNDHHCVIISTVMAEAWMWGRDFYDSLRPAINKLLSEHDLAGRDLRVDTYDEYVNRYKAGTLVTWIPTLEAEKVVF